MRTFEIHRRQVREVLELLQALLEAGVLGTFNHHSHSNAAALSRESQSRYRQLDL